MPFLRLFWTEGCTVYSRSRIAQLSPQISLSIRSKLIPILTVLMAVKCCLKSEKDFQKQN